jgi:hypothetical protein
MKTPSVVFKNDKISLEGNFEFELSNIILVDDLQVKYNSEEIIEMLSEQLKQDFAKFMDENL